MSQNILRFMQECSLESVSFRFGPSECVINLHVHMYVCKISALSKLVMGSIGNAVLQKWNAITA